MNKENFFKTINENIEQTGFHVTVVKSSENPRFAYTIGNLKQLGFELVFAGAENFLYDDVITILKETVQSLITNRDNNDVIEVSNIGRFKLSTTDNSWIEKMLLGVYDYYNVRDFKAFQIVPYESVYAKDVPNMSKPWNAGNIIWKWLDDSIRWNLPVPKNSTAITEVDVLFGKKVTEVMRWEENEWEAFTKNGEDIDKSDIRVVPIATLLGIDETLTPILDLEKEKGLWRKDGTSKWNDWE
jgi:Domain of unknown function (DUF4262)